MRDLMPWSRPRPVARREDADPFTTLHREVNRLFDQMLGGFPAMAGGAMPAAFSSWPTLEVAEKEGEYLVTAELPGLEEKDVELSIANDVLAIRGEKKSDVEDKDKRFSEHFYGRFERRIPLSNDVDRDKISAAFKNGVLTVTLPKSAQAVSEAKKIPIASAS